VFTFDTSVHNKMWLYDYLSAAVDLDADHLDAAEIADALGGGASKPCSFPMTVSTDSGMPTGDDRRPT
jgi:hypothetical protein